jgi:preprotein translocase subunit SecG
MALEKELDEVDWDDFDEHPDRLRSREIDVAKAAQEGDSRNRRVILGELRIKLLEYDELLIKARTLESFQKPSDRNYRSVRRYHHNTKPLMDAEMDAIRSKEDTISLRSGREWASFDGGVETMIGQLDHFLQKLFGCKHPPLQQYFRTPELRAKTTNSYISLYSSSRIDKLINILITVVIFMLLVVPVLVLYHLTASNGDSSSNGDNKSTDNNTRNTINAVGVLMVFTLLFSAAMSLVTKAARHELFAASAAYCAILVVFIGNLVVPA